MTDIIRTCNHSKQLQRFLDTLAENITVEENIALIANFIRDAQLGKTILKGQKKKIGASACYKYGLHLKRLDHFWKKSFSLISSVDMEHFISELENDRFVTHKGKPYTEESKYDFKKVIRKFFKWLLRADFPDGEAARYAKLTFWIDTSRPKPEVDSLDRDEVKTLTDGAKLRDKLTLWMLFDSGARAQEFLNMRVKDLKFKKDYYTVRIRHETSKTKGRTIDLSMQETVKLLTLWLDVHPMRDSNGLSGEAQIVPIRYDNMRKQIRNLGNRILNRKITPHTMRHSSATYWAAKLSQFQLCYRFGWAMNSDMPERYIDKAGVAAKQTSKIERRDSLQELAEKNQELMEEMAQMRAQIEKSVTIEEFEHFAERFTPLFTKALMERVPRKPASVDMQKKAEDALNTHYTHSNGKLQ